MNLSTANEVSLPRQEFDETFATIKVLLAENTDPRELIMTDPFFENRPTKVDLREHLQHLYDRMSEISETISSSTSMVTIDFS
jgi:hypothetical protein